MSSISLACTIAAIICGMGLLCVGVDSGMYNYPPRNRWKWLLGLLIATVLLTFAAVLTGGKDCTDYTTFDYEYGHVPISCSVAHPNSEMEKS